MPSDNEPGPSHSSLQEPHVKRRRLHGACDICRRKKIKCNSAEMPNKTCSNCIAYNLECTHNIPRHASKKETEKSYIQTLEERLDKMEQLLRNLRPGMDIEQSVVSSNSPESVHSAHTPPSISYSRSAPVTDLPYPSPQTLPDSTAFHTSPPVGIQDLSDEEEFADATVLANRLGKLAVGHPEDRFFGKSSAFMLMQHATNVKQEMTGVEIPPEKSQRRSRFWTPHFWELEHSNSDLPQFEFPEKDLLNNLISLYFDRLNVYVPLLHRPTFERDLANDLHLHDTGFGQVVLMVCSMASRCTDDPRVILPNDASGLSSGFKYFRQTRLMRNQLLEKASLYDLQYFCLVIPFLLASALPQAGWGLVALGLRFAQDRGAHRRRGEQKPTVAHELWKRCFWCLISYDRMISSFVGRPCAMQDEDFDADLPIECDDEYWECEDPEQNWKQHSGKPCKVTAFNAHLRLCEILAFTLRTLYSTRKSKLLTGSIGDQWEERVVAGLDSSLNKWKGSLPDHLRWDPSQPKTLFLHQSAFVHATYYYIQIQIHRPFIQKKTSQSFPSLAICTNAARACSHLVDAKGTGWIHPYPNFFMAAFASGIVLLLHTYGGRKAGLKTDLEKEAKDIQRCIDALRAMEMKWHVAGRLYDILKDLSTVEGEVSVPKFISAKRQRDGRLEEPWQRQPTDSVTTSPNQPRPQKPRPIRQPKGWPPSPPSPSVLSSTLLNAERDKSQISTGPSLEQTPATQLAPESQEPHIFNSTNALPQYSGSNPSPMGSSSLGSDGWDLNQLVLAQMNFGAMPQSFGGPMPQAQDFSNTVANSFRNSGDLPLGEHAQMPGAFPNQEQPLSSISPSMGQNRLIDLDRDMTALWSDVPSDFNFEEWDHFVAGINGTGGQ